MKICVVTASLNMKRYLRQTVDSVLRNLSPGDEYFIVDGGSTDGSQDVIRSYAPSLSGWISESDRSYSEAIAKGFARTSGEIMCWINVGDVLLSGALARARELLLKTAADLIFGDDFYIDEEGRVLAFARGYVSDLRRALLYGAWTPLQDACFWRRALYDRVGGLDADVRYAADYDLFLRMAQAGKCVYVPEAFSAFRRHPGQKSIAFSPQYNAERESARRRELGRARRSAMVRVAATAWYKTRARWRAHISHRLWQRPELVGRSIDDLACSAYWPAPRGR